MESHFAQEEEKSVLHTARASSAGSLQNSTADERTMPVTLLLKFTFAVIFPTWTSTKLHKKKSIEDISNLTKQNAYALQRNNMEWNWQ